MATKQTYSPWVQKKYKKLTYFIRSYIEYEVTDTPNKKTFKVINAGFETKTRKYVSIEKLKITVSDGYGNKFECSKKFAGTSATSKIPYISGKIFTWDRKTTDSYFNVTVTVDFGKTIFTGQSKTAKITIPIELTAKSKPIVSFMAVRDSETSSTLTLTVDTQGRTMYINAPTVKRNGTTITPNFGVTFPYLIETETKTITASDTIYATQSYDYTYHGVVGAYTFDLESGIEYITPPRWTPTQTSTSEGEPAVLINNANLPIPDVDLYGNASIRVYAKDYVKTASAGYDVYTLLPDDYGWQIEPQDDGSWKLCIALKEQYVSDPTSGTGEAEIKIEYVTYTASDVIDNVAIFNTNRNANFSTGLANNIFIGGCTLTDYSSRVWYSAVNNPLYIPDTNYVEVGSNDTRVMGLVKVGDYLGVVKQSKSTDASVFLIYPTSFDDETTFATKACVSGVGALSNYCFNVLGDETLFLSPRGIMAIEPYEDEASRVKDRSFYVNGKLLEEPNLEEAYSFVWNGLYLLAINNNVYVLDGNQRNSWGNQKTNLVYECYYLENVPAQTMFSYDGELWFSDKAGNLCRFKQPNEADAYSDNGDPVVARWSTIADDDNALHYLKSLSKKGTLVSLLPEKGTTARVYIKKDEQDVLEPVVESDPIPDKTVLPPSVYTKKKVKKYKRLQFIVEDITANPFGVDKIIKSYIVGNYAKK